jgi:ectoine hydroxylase
MSTETQILVSEAAPLDRQPALSALRLSPEDLWRFRQNGYLIFERLFSSAELDIMRAELPAIFSENTPRRVLEKNGSVRSVFASHLTNEVFNRFARLDRLVTPAKQILGNDVYVHQFKINAKVALEGDQWEWHQDYLYWLKEDAMPRPTVLTAVLFLEETNEFNGPMLIIPGSHLGGVVDVDIHQKYRLDGKQKDQAAPPQWAATLTADLKYKIDKHILRGLMEKRSIRAVTVPAGSVMFFHGNLFHASTNNLSPWDRISVFVSYNSVANALRDKENPRPEFIAARDFRPLETIDDDALLEWEAAR